MRFFEQARSIPSGTITPRRYDIDEVGDFKSGALNKEGKHVEAEWSRPVRFELPIVFPEPAQPLLFAIAHRFQWFSRTGRPARLHLADDKNSIFVGHQIDLAHRTTIVLNDNRVAAAREVTGGGLFAARAESVLFL